MPETHMEELHEIQCRKLLADHHLGRLALVDAKGPVIVPVNYLAEVTGRRIRIPDDLPFTWWG